MKDDMKTIAAFDNPLYANLAKSKLESEGIYCFLADENLVGTNMLYSTAVGNVKLQVKEEDEAKARSILEIDESNEDYYRGDIAATEQNTDYTCPHCGSEHISDERFHKKYPWLSVLGIGIPIIISAKKWQCRECGTRWSEKMPVSLFIVRLVFIFVAASVIALFIYNRVL